MLLMQMFLLRTVRPGDSISISYGDLLNDFLLLDYGAQCLLSRCSTHCVSYSTLCIVAPASGHNSCMHAGFIVANNPHDRVQLRFDLRLFEAAMAVSGVWHAQLVHTIRLPRSIH